MIINRTFWQNMIEEAWKHKNILWLMGVRRIGKTSLCRSLADIEYFDCELPRVRQLFDDPEAFLASKADKRIVLDEIHRLDNPSELLKIAADHYPQVKIIATGSSTLGASVKFKDSLTGRRKQVWLTPMLLQEMNIFGNHDLRHRFLFGGFPAFFTSAALPESDFQDWIDSYWAKDIQEMFRVNKRSSFQKFAELLLAHSGGIFEVTKFSDACEVSRATIDNYLTILEETLVVHIIRPYSSHKPSEIIKAPKVYGFDTGFVCYAKGWRELRPEDLGLLWEQCVLNEIQAHLQIYSLKLIYYWRDKQGHEIDFVIPNKKDNSLTAIECKFTIAKKDNVGSHLDAITRNIKHFREIYPRGENLVVASDVDIPFERSCDGVKLSFVNAHDLIKELKSMISVC